MAIDITCPTNGEPFMEWSPDLSISAEVDKHMAENHPEWSRLSKFTFYPKNGIKCPLCGSPCKTLKSLYMHAGKTHQDYERVDTMVWRKIA